MELTESLKFANLPLTPNSTKLLTPFFKYLQFDFKSCLIQSYNILISIEDSEEIISVDFEYKDSGRVYRIEFIRNSEELSLKATHPDVYPNILNFVNCLSLSTVSINRILKEA